VYRLLDERASVAAKKIYDDIFKGEAFNSQFDDLHTSAVRRTGNRKKLIMNEYLRLRKEAVNRTLFGAKTGKVSSPTVQQLFVSR
jgi:hypothetical protein